MRVEHGRLSIEQSRIPEGSRLPVIFHVIKQPGQPSEVSGRWSVVREGCQKYTFFHLTAKMNGLMFTGYKDIFFLGLFESS